MSYRREVLEIKAIAHEIYKKVLHKGLKKRLTKLL